MIEDAEWEDSTLPEWMSPAVGDEFDGIDEPLPAFLDHAVSAIEGDPSPEAAKITIVPFDLPIGAPSPRDTHGRMYDDDKRREVVTLYLTHGNMKAVAAETGVPHATIITWTRSDWWERVAHSVRAHVETDVRAKLSAVNLKALDNVLRMMEEGETKIGKDGRARQVPVGARDTMLIAAMAYDKLRLSLNLPGKITDQELGKTLSEQLSKLSDYMNAKVVSEQ